MRERALSFGVDAERYDRSRPSYPDELVERLAGDDVRRVLDLGCGTGKAARPFVARGCDVLGVEPDERMADVAREHGLHVEVVRFEEWDARGRTFDLAVCGQAWHWLDRERAIPKVVAALRRGGRFAAFWNVQQRDELTDAVEEIYLRLAPDLWALRDPTAVPDYGGELQACDELAHVDSWTYGHELLYSRAEWLAVLRTYSDHIALPLEQREPLLSAIGDAIDANGGSRLVRYETRVVTAVRSYGSP